MKRLMAGMLLVGLILVIGEAAAGKLSYNLKPVRVAEGVYAFFGDTRHFTRKNGGNIVNTGFIITDIGVVVIDTGPSVKYGREMRAAIASVTPKPIVQVYNTHNHPDHYFGNQAFKDVPIAALDAARKVMSHEGEAVAENLYRLVGDWMLGTEVVLPSDTVSSSGRRFGGRLIRTIAYNGHTDGDLVVIDEQTGVVFAGDLVFFNRAPTTPHAEIPAWLDVLEQLRKTPFRVMIPGHGPMVRDTRAIDQTAGYLSWLQKAFSDAAASGREMTEVMRMDIPASFSNLSMVREELVRSVQHKWPDIVKATLPLAEQKQEQ